MPAFTTEPLFHPSYLSCSYSSLAFSGMWRSFLLPLSGLCHHIDSCHIFPAPFNKKTTQTTGQQYCYCCLYSDPHNGSRFSNSEFFIEATRPDAIVFSSRYLNRMKHPQSETLNLYKNSGVKIYRTDLNGAL